MKTTATIKREKFQFLQKKLLIVWMFLKKTELPRRTDLKELHEDYLKFAKGKVTTKFLFGKNHLGKVLKEFGCLRVRTGDKPYWILPDEFATEDLLFVLERIKWEILDE